MTDAPRGANWWRRLLLSVRAFEDAMDTSYDDVQDRRITVIEREIAELRAMVESSVRAAARRPDLVHSGAIDAPVDGALDTREGS